METRALKRNIVPYLALGLFALGAAYLSVAPAKAGAVPVPPQVQALAQKYAQKLAQWGANPVIVQAVRKSNASGGVPGMSNAKWIGLDDNDPVVKALQTNAAGKLVTKWQEDKRLGKLNVRDEKGNLVAASTSAKPLLYNNVNRPPFVNAMKGQPWAASKMKPDPTTQRQAVQISAPIMDGGRVIGVIHSALQVQ